MILESILDLFIFKTRNEGRKLNANQLLAWKGSLLLRMVPTGMLILRTILVDFQIS